SVAYHVAGIFLQVAFYNVEDLIPHAWYMETKRVPVIYVTAAFNLIISYPACIGKGKLHFISIEELLITAFDGFKFREFNLSDAFQVIINLTVFIKKLLLIFHILPLAATA